MSGFETVIGLEVHVQLNLRSKLFSPSPVGFGGEPNSRVSVVELGLPGVLPVVNEKAIEVAVRAAIALDAEVQHETKFDRKNYFYADLPKGFQTSQFDKPFCRGGRVPLGDGRYGALNRIHLEEDAGKNMHADAGSTVDLNRAGVTLCEIVGEPDLHTPEDAAAFLENLKQILQYSGVSDCDMEKGSLRCDANVSLRPQGSTELGDKVEIKNLNSFKMVQRALEYEERRQAATLSAGGKIVQETRLWNDEKGETASMRSKEDAHDYRYFPEPDLPPLFIEQSFVDEIRRTLPELPDARRARYASDFGLPEYDIGVLTADHALGEYFEAVTAQGGNAKEAANWVMTEVQRALNETHTKIADFSIAPDRLGELIAAQGLGKVSRQAAKKVFNHMLETGDDAATAIRELGLEQISDTGALEAIVQQVVDANPKPVEDYRAGKQKALHALKGLCMRETKGKANPAVVEELLLKLLG